MSDYADLVVQSIHKRRTEFATASALFSVLIHLALLLALAFSPVNVPFWQQLLNDEVPRDSPMHLQDVNREPSPPVMRHAESARAFAGGEPAARVQQAVDLEAPIDRGNIEPPPAVYDRDLAPAPTLPELDLPPDVEAWQPRQEIVKVERASVRDELAARERRRIPRIERVLAASDVVYPAKPAAPPPTAVQNGADGTMAKPGLAAIMRRVTSVASTRPDIPAPPDPIARSGSGVLAETAADVTDLQPIEALLTARITTFASKHEPDYAYFRVEINRRSEEALPVLPKDVLFVQDCSASLSEQRLYFCRQGLTESLPLIGPEDRFNIVAFRDQVESCFEGWMTNSPASLARAEQFVQGLQSQGETDIFTAIRAALNFTVQPGRPVIVILISDGHATTGLTDGAAIIREFTQANRGAISIFTMGTTPQAYLYLLDLLSFSNRGDSRVVTRGRWDIPKDLRGISEEVRNPVLSEVGLQVAESTRCEVYPVQTMNLFRDRPLVLYGRYPRALGHVVLQATGQAAAKKCDMIFDLNLQDAPAEEDEDLRQTWARQKIYHLLGEHARTGNPALIPEIDATARAYRVPVPYRDML